MEKILSQSARDVAHPQIGSADTSTSLGGYPDGPPSARPHYLLPHHLQQLTAIAPDVSEERGYRTEITPSVLASYGYASKAGKPLPWVRECVPALLIPIWNAAGQESLVQIRPDNPRIKDGKPIKYETPPGFKMCVDVHPRIRAQIKDPTIPLWITEGVKKADSAISRGLCCVALLGVWNWRGANDKGGMTALGDWDDFAFKSKDGTRRQVRIAFDSDATHKPEVQKALARFAAFLESRGAAVSIVSLPDCQGIEKTGLDDFFERGGTIEDLESLVLAAETQKTAVDPKPKALTPDEIRAAFKKAAGQVAEPCSLADVKATFRRWVYLEDEALIEVVLGFVAANLMDGDAVWLMLVGASGRGKTEVTNPLLGLPFVREVATVTTSSLLSGSSKRDRAANSKGGLLREIGDFGFLLLKDFTSVLSMHRDARAEVLAALREIYDGSWTRHVGSDGGQELQWKGKISALACCTEAIDEHHAVIGSMGERFAFFRLPDVDEDALARRVLDFMGDERQMRQELRQSVAGLFAGLEIPARAPRLDAEDTRRMIALARLTAHCRSAVLRDGYSREITLPLDSEAPTRIAKILARIFTGLVVIGVERNDAWRILRRIAFDSMHKVRRLVFDEIIKRGGGPVGTAEVALALDIPTQTARRALEDLTAHKILTRAKISAEGKKRGGVQDFWQLGEWCRDVLPPLGIAKKYFFPEKSSDGVFGVQEEKDVKASTLLHDFSGKKSEGEAIY